MADCPNHDSGNHDDNGDQEQRGDKLFTKCTCGATVSVDDVTIDYDDQA